MPIVFLRIRRKGQASHSVSKARIRTFLQINRLAYGSDFMLNNVVFYRICIKPGLAKFNQQEGHLNRKDSPKSCASVCIHRKLGNWFKSNAVSYKQRHLFVLLNIRCDRCILFYRPIILFLLRCVTGAIQVAEGRLRPTGLESKPLTPNRRSIWVVMSFNKDNDSNS